MTKKDFSSPLVDSSCHSNCMPPLLSPTPNLQHVIVMLYVQIQGHSFQTSWIHLSEVQGEILDIYYGYLSF